MSGAVVRYHYTGEGLAVIMAVDGAFGAGENINSRRKIVLE